MTIELKAERVTYEMGDASGYRYTIEAERDPEYGWSAVVTMRTSGSKTAEGAIGHLKSAAESFLWQLKKTGWCEP